jgi:hypothetical protein
MKTPYTNDVEHLFYLALSDNDFSSASELFHLAVTLNHHAKPFSNSMKEYFWSDFEETVLSRFFILPKKLNGIFKPEEAEIEWARIESLAGPIIETAKTNSNLKKDIVMFLAYDIQGWLGSRNLRAEWFEDFLWKHQIVREWCAEKSMVNFYHPVVRWVSQDVKDLQEKLIESKINLNGPFRDKHHELGSGRHRLFQYAKSKSALSSLQKAGVDFNLPLEENIHNQFFYANKLSQPKKNSMPTLTEFYICQTLSEGRDAFQSMLDITTDFNRQWLKTKDLLSSVNMWNDDAEKIMMINLGDIDFFSPESLVSPFDHTFNFLKECTTPFKYFSDLPNTSINTDKLAAVFKKAAPLIFSDINNGDFWMDYLFCADKITEKCRTSCKLFISNDDSVKIKQLLLSPDNLTKFIQTNDSKETSAFSGAISEHYPSFNTDYLAWTTPNSKGKSAVDTLISGNLSKNQAIRSITNDLYENEKMFEFLTLNQQKFILASLPDPASSVSFFKSFEECDSKQKLILHAISIMGADFNLSMPATLKLLGCRTIEQNSVAENFILLGSNGSSFESKKVTKKSI